MVGCVAWGFAQDSNEDPNSWYIQGGLGASWSLQKHAGFGELLSPAGEIAVGKQFMPQLSARVAIGGWRGRYVDYNNIDHGAYRGQVTLDGVWNISQTFALNPVRPVDVNFILGVGYARNWTTHVSSLVARTGLGMGVRLCKAWDFNLEATVNGVSSHWDTRRGGGFDAFVNVLVGATYKFGTGYKCKSCQPVRIDNQKINDARVDTVRVVEVDTVFVEKQAPVEAAEVAKAPGIERYVEFEINSTVVRESQQGQVADIAGYMREWPDSQVKVMGYADKGTGTVAINLRLAKERAQVVADELANKYGISRSRMIVDSMTDQYTQQPFQQNAMNRVVIMTSKPE